MSITLSVRHLEWNFHHLNRSSVIFDVCGVLLLNEHEAHLFDDNNFTISIPIIDREACDFIRAVRQDSSEYVGEVGLEIQVRKGSDGNLEIDRLFNIWLDSSAEEPPKNWGPNIVICLSGRGRGYLQPEIGVYRNGIHAPLPDIPSDEGEENIADENP